MSLPYQFNFRQKIDRRHVLKGAGVAMSLPWLSAMTPSFANAAEQQAPKRFVSMTLGLGLVSKNLTPETAGRDYKPSLYMQELQSLRDDVTVISGTSHPGVSGGHRAEACILTANPNGSKGVGKNTISIDQYMAKYLGGETRYPSLVLSSSGSNSPSYTENGAMIPAQDSPSRLFGQLFVDESASNRQRHIRRIQEGRSIMDVVMQDAKQLSKKVGTADRHRLEEYFTSVRDLEVRMAESEAWSHRPKPQVDAKKPVDIRNSADFIGRQKLMTEMIKLALQTDSSRFVSYHLGGSGGVVPLEGVAEGYHNLSHHGQDEEKLDQLALVEAGIISQWGAFLQALKDVKQQGGSLLDQTTVMLTSNLGNASAHDTRNLPVLVGGGGFKHGQHIAFDQKNNYPLPNLFVSCLQNLGMETDQFATSTGTLTGLDRA